MGRFSPQQATPDLTPQLLAQALSSLGDIPAGIINRRRYEENAGRVKRVQSAEDYGRGIRSGAAPSEDVTIGVPDASAGLTGVPSAADLSRQMRGGDSIHNALEAPAPVAGGPLDSPPSSAELSRALPNVRSTLFAPPSPAAPAGGTSDAFAPGVLAQAMQATPTSSRGRTGADRSVLSGTPAPDGRDSAATHPGAFDPATRSFGGSPLQQATAARHAAPGGSQVTLPRSSDRYVPLDDSHYLDTFHTPEADRERQQLESAQQQRELAATTTATERARREADYIAAGVAPNRARIYVDNPALAADDPLLAKPSPTANTRAPEKFNVDGKPVQGLVDRAGHYYDASGNPITGQITPFVAPSGEGGKFQADQQNKILDDYARDTKDFHQIMGGWDVLLGATKDPTLATPFAITDAYARITNPGAIVRPTTMEMIDHMGSIGQRMRKAWEKNSNGALPTDILNDFKRTLYNIVQEHKTQYDQIRQKSILRGKGIGVNVSPLLEDYTLVDPLAPTVTPGAPKNPWRP